MLKNEIELSESGIFQPTMSVEAAVAAFKQVEEVNRKILTKDDYAMIKVNRKMPDGTWKSEDHPFRKKSGSDKLSCFWGISVETSKVERTELSDGSYVYKVSVRAFKKIADGKEYSKEKSAIVSSLEKEKTEKMAMSPRKEHDVMSAAETRAYGRAISSFLGLSEPTAEEVEGGITDEYPKEIRACKCGPNFEAIAPDSRQCKNCGGKKI